MTKITGGLGVTGLGLKPGRLISCSGALRLP
jgi:hypothetical protein